MSIGIRLHDAAGDTFAQKVKSARAQGFGCAHVALSKVMSPDIMESSAATPGLAEHVRRTMDGMPVAVLGCYLNLAHPDEAVYRKTLAAYVGQLRLARAINAGVVGTETGNPNAEYRYEPSTSHGEDALRLFIDRLAPVVQAAEKLGALIAIEPVYTHIVCDPKRARRVLDAINSPALRIIFDPVNMLHADNIDRRDALLDEAMELLGDDIAVVHAKDYVMKDGKVVSLAAGAGEMDYGALCRMLVRHKPHIDITLEDTTPANAPDALKFLERKLLEARG